jgi:uncharacterized protein
VDRDAPRSSGGTELQVLDVDECMRRLTNHRPRIGRVAILDDGVPIVLPVNYVFTEGTVIFRTNPGSKLAAAVRHQVASFEIDEVDETWHQGWSVLVTGRLAEVFDNVEIARLEALPLRPWAGDKATFVRLHPGRISGRSLG